MDQQKGQACVGKPGRQRHGVARAFGAVDATTIGLVWRVTTLPMLSSAYAWLNGAAAACRRSREPHRFSNGLVIRVGCTLEPMARGCPRGEHESYEPKEVPMNAQTQSTATTEHRDVRRVGAAWRRRGRFSSGNEARPDTPAKVRVGRYSQGAERLPDSPRKLRVGRFSTGSERRPDAPDKLRRGSFADGYR
jgi:hypothetical protein